MSQAPSMASSQHKKSGAARVVGGLAALLALAAIALIALGAIGLANVATPNMQGFNPGATVTVTDAGMSVYARSDNDRASTVCTADDGSATTLARPTSEFSVDVSGSDFYEVARTSEDLAAGSYTLTCQGTEQALYVGPAAPNTSAGGLMGPASLVGGIMLAFFVLVLIVIALVMGRSRASKQAVAPQGPAYPYQPSAGYPPPPGGPHPSQSSHPAAGQQGPYGSAPPPPSPYGEQNGATTAFSEQGTPNQSQAPPPPPGWTPTSREPTQAIAYGQGEYGPPERQTHGQSQEHTSEEVGGESDEEPQDEPYSTQDPDAGDEPAPGSDQSNGEGQPDDQPRHYPPPPPPQ
ncbi:MAG: hypothetical protein WBG76_11595 [Ornithinimicrobium sp.]